MQYTRGIKIPASKTALTSDVKNLCECHGASLLPNQTACLILQGRNLQILFQFIHLGFLWILRGSDNAVESVLARPMRIPAENRGFLVTVHRTREFQLGYKMKPSAHTYINQALKKTHGFFRLVSTASSMARMIETKDHRYLIRHQCYILRVCTYHSQGSCRWIWWKRISRSFGMKSAIFNIYIQDSKWDLLKKCRKPFTVRYILEYLISLYQGYLKFFYNYQNIDSKGESMQSPIALPWLDEVISQFPEENPDSSKYVFRPKVSFLIHFFEITNSYHHPNSYHSNSYHRLTFLFILRIWLKPPSRYLFHWFPKNLFEVFIREHSQLSTTYR